MDYQEVELVNIKKIDESGRVEELSPPPSSSSVVVSSETSSPVNGANLLKPGTKIRPDVSEEDAIKLAERLYGITTSEISSLVSYDDRNFLIYVDR